MVLKRPLKWLTAVVPRRTAGRLGRCSTAAAVWHWLTAKEAELMAVDVLAVRWWWLEEKQLVLVCQLVKNAAVFQSVGRSSQTEDF